MDSCESDSCTVIVLAALLKVLTLRLRLLEVCHSKVKANLAQNEVKYTSLWVSALLSPEG